MTIAEARTSCKAALGKIPRDILVVALIVAASLASFGLGVLAGREGAAAPVLVEDAPAAAAAAGEGGEVVASRAGTKYYLPWCGGAKNISPANLVTFPSESAAEAAGYTPAANCRGI